jgi:hypothetical protein
VIRATLPLAVLSAVVLTAPVQRTQTPAPSVAVVTVKNPIPVARGAETIELSVDALRRAMTFDDVRRIHVRDDKTGKDLLTQAVDLNDDGTFEQLIFQADLAAGETRTFALSVGERHIPTRDEFRAYGRFVRERRDDFAWENDLVAHRMYGAALETWKQEPLTSSAVDVWVKRTHRLIVNDWYMIDDYHQDHGDGADLYSSGTSRGCGGNGIWQDGKLYASANFRETRVLANGPIRVLFELGYDAWSAGGQKVGELKRISLDAGQHLNKFESTYAVPSPRPLTQAAGIRSLAGAEFAERRPAGLLRSWEAFKGSDGNLGCGVLVDPRELVDMVKAGGDYLVVTRVPGGTPATYWAGTAWDKGGDITTAAAWDKYLDEWAARLKGPVGVTITPKA